MTDKSLKHKGEIVRVADDSIAYVYVRDKDRTLSFIPSAIGNYRGETFVELGLIAGTEVEFEAQSKTGAITHVRVPVRSADSVRR